ncbi:hypothetical protein GCM10011587_02930 [Pyruvatibacter mobilis]|nr:hypothetical protein GCM10011587_02930 [Pyruvatibacter mobilis]
MDPHGDRAVIVNASINGNTTRQALERMPYDVQSNGVDLLLAQFGLNDCNQWESDRGHPRVSPAAFAANLEEICTRALSFGAKGIVLNTNHPTLRDRDTMPFSQNTYEDKNREYNNIVRDLAARSSLREKITLIDIETSFLNATKNDRDKLGQLLLEDNLHLSLEGHNLYHATVKPVFSKVLKNEFGIKVK